MKADATGLFSQKIFASHGFTACLELPYKEYRDENNQQIFEVESPHEVFKIYYKSLDAKNEQKHSFWKKIADKFHKIWSYCVTFLTRKDNKKMHN